MVILLLHTGGAGSQDASGKRGARSGVEASRHVVSFERLLLASTCRAACAGALLAVTNMCACCSPQFNNRSMFDILCRLNGSVFTRVLLKALGFGLIGAVAIVLHEHNPDKYSSFWTPESDMHTYMSMMVALLIGFRTNNCYTRYDQGVRIAGAMRTHARTIVGQATALHLVGKCWGGRASHRRDSAADNVALPLLQTAHA